MNNFVDVLDGVNDVENGLDAVTALASVLDSDAGIIDSKTIAKGILFSVDAMRAKIAKCREILEATSNI